MNGGEVRVTLRAEIRAAPEGKWSLRCFLETHQPNGSLETSSPLHVRTIYDTIAFAQAAATAMALARGVSGRNILWDGGE